MRQEELRQQKQTLEARINALQSRRITVVKEMRKATADSRQRADAIRQRKSTPIPSRKADSPEIKDWHNNPMPAERECELRLYWRGRRPSGYGVCQPQKNLRRASGRAVLHIEIIDLLRIRN